jgi:hypothetical protein
LGLQLVSCSTNLRIDIRPEKANYTPKGDLIGVDQPLFVQFRPGGNVPDYAKELVTTLPGFTTGIARDEDPYQTRLGWWDSVVAQHDHGWTDDDREYVEQRILAVGDPNIVALSEPVAVAPYTNWAKHRKVQGRRTLDNVIADIQAVWDTAGFDVGQAVAHERQNGNDPRILEFLQGLVGQESDVEIVAA